MEDLDGRMVLLSEETLKKIFLVEKTFHLSGEITEIIIRKMADLLLDIKKESINNEIKQTAKIILKEVAEYWKADLKPPPVAQIKYNLENQNRYSSVLFDKAISYLIYEELIELDVSDRGVERIARPI
jgi:hypothetical protein